MANVLYAVASTARDPFGVSVLKDSLAQLAAPAQTYKQSIDRSKMAVTAILTTRRPDRQGDVIDPSGGDFSEHTTNPIVLFHHGKAGHKLPIGKAEDSDGNYTVRVVKSKDGENVLVGTTHFSQSNRFANDVFGLVAEDILRGVSIGFDPADLDESVEELGPSPTLERSALHFHNWKLLEYSHTPIGVNRDALTVAVAKAHENPRLMHPVLLKHLAPLATPRRTTVSGAASERNTNPAKVTKAFDESKHRRNHGKFASVGGGQKPHIHTNKQSVEIYKNNNDERKDSVVKTFAKKHSVPEQKVREQFESHANGGKFPLVNVTDSDVHNYHLDRVHGDDDRADRRVVLLAKKKGIEPEVIAAELNHHISKLRSTGPGGPTEKALVSSRVVKAMDDEEDDTGSDADEPNDMDDEDTEAETASATDDSDDDYNPAEDNPNDDPDLAAANSPYIDHDDDTPPSPTVQTFLDGSQGILDLCSAIEQGMKKSEHMKGRKYGMKICAELRQTAMDVKKFADKVRSELAAPMAPVKEGGGPDGDEDTEEETPEEGASDDENAEPETDEDGALVTKGGYTPRRWTFADLANNTPSTNGHATADTTSAKQVKSLGRENAKLKKMLDGLLTDIEAANNRRR